MTDTDQTIFEEFARGDLGLFDAIERLQAIGHEPKEAERIVSEWAECEEK